MTARAGVPHVDGLLVEVVGKISAPQTPGEHMPSPSAAGMACLLPATRLHGSETGVALVDPSLLLESQVANHKPQAGSLEVIRSI